MPAIQESAVRWLTMSTFPNADGVPALVLNNFEKLTHWRKRVSGLDVQRAGRERAIGNA